MPSAWQRDFRRGFAGLLAAVALVAFDPAPAHALAELSLIDREARNDPTQLRFEPVCNARLEGRIETGDFDRIKEKFDTFVADSRVAPVIARIEQQLDKYKLTDLHYGLRAMDPSFYALCLSSVGGDLKEALKIATLFNGWMMVVGLDPIFNQPDPCYSACAVIFMTAKRRDGIYESNAHKRYPGRFLHYKARLGFHAPELEFPASQGPTVTTKLAQDAYAAAITSVREITVDRSSPHAWERAALARHRGTDFPAGLLIEMLTTPQQSMSEIAFVSEAVDWGIELFGFDPPKALTDRFAMMVCSNIASKRCDHSGAEDRCGDGFITSAWWLSNMVSGVKTLVPKVPGSKFHLPPTPESELQDDRTTLKELMEKWKFKLSTLWPKSGSGRVSVRSAVLQPGPGSFSTRQPCALVATLHGEQLVNLEAQTFNGSQLYWLKERADGPALGIEDHDHIGTENAIVAGRYRADTPEHVSLTRMLPGKARLSDLEGDPWAWHSAGQPILNSKPSRRP
jgi:hypothetical protein